MPLFTAYFDESGTHDGSPAVVVGGYLGVVKNWEEFGQVWNTHIIKREGIKVLHRVDLEKFEGEFKGWTRDRQIRVIRRAHKIIKKYTQIGIGVSHAVVLADFEKVMPDVVIRAFGGAYGWAAHNCLIYVSRWADHHGYREPIHWFFEAGAKGRHQVDRMFDVLVNPPSGAKPSQIVSEKLRVASWTFALKQCVCQLQSADFYAYEAYKEMDNRVVAGHKRDIRKSALDLFRPTDQRYYSDKNHLQRWVDDQRDIMKILEDRERRLRDAGREDLIHN